MVSEDGTFAALNSSTGEGQRKTETDVFIGAARRSSTMLPTWRPADSYSSSDPRRVGSGDGYLYAIGGAGTE